MKLLFDNNLSPKLVRRIAHLYNESSHVAMSELGSAKDIDVWEYARKEGYCLVTKDADFNDLLALKGFPPKVVWIRIGNCTTHQIVELLHDQHDTLLTFESDDSSGLLELQ